jgi:CDGSH-type Zn-finger protein
VSDGVVITPQEDGSYHVQGDFKIVLSDGTEIEAGREVWLCRCGQSSTRPFCDGSHRKAEFASNNGDMRDQSG